MMRTFSSFAYAIGLLMMVPVPGADVSPASAESGQIVGLASTTFTDVGYFCTQKPDFCRKAAELALAIGANAKSNINLIQNWASDTVEYKMFTMPPSVAVVLGDRNGLEGFRSTLEE